MKKAPLFMTAMLAALLLPACQSVSTPEPVSPTQASENMTTDYALPEIPPAKLFQHATPVMMTLKNGMPFWYVENPMIPLVSLKVVFPFGAAYDPADKSGLSSLTAALLKEGANGKSAQDLSDEIEFIGAVLSPNTTQDAASISLQAMTQFFEKGLVLLSEIWLKPDFTQDAFNRVQKIFLNGLKQRESSPQAMAKLASNAAYFGDNHPYSRSVDGYIDTLNRITLDDVKKCYAERFSPADAAIIAVGNIPAQELKSMLDARFGSLTYDPGKRAELDPQVPAPEPRLTIVHKPNAPQTVIRIYQPGIKVTSLKTLPWQFLNIPFGGSFTSRLMQNIREDKGYSYGASSVLSAQKYAGVLLSTSDVSSDVTGPALQEFINELSRLNKGDFTEEEFERARETWKSELVQSIETQAGMLATISGLFLNKKPVDAINAFARELQTYDLEKFNAIAHEFPGIEQATITLVGDKDLILEQIKDMNLPKPTFRDAEGKLISE